MEIVVYSLNGEYVICELHKEEYTVNTVLFDFEKAEREDYLLDDYIHL